MFAASDVDSHILSWTALGTLILALVSSAIGWRRTWKHSQRPVDNKVVLDQLAADKAEILGHVTANRIQANRYTAKAVADLREHMVETTDSLFDMVSEVDSKVTKLGNRKNVRVPAKVVSVETESVLV